MGFYNNYIIPRVTDFACGASVITDKRRQVVPAAQGRVVEVGIGSGLNLPFYDPAHVEQVIGVDPGDGMWRRSAKKRAAARVPVERIGLSGEQIPLDDNFADTVVITYALCTIPDPIAALTEMRRILKPDGKMLFVEHGASKDASVRKWQSRIDPVWKRLAGGCHTGRPIVDYVREAGWKIDHLEEGYVPGPKVLGYQYWGSAVAA